MSDVNLDTLAMFLLAEVSPNISPEMHRVFVIALRDGCAVAGRGSHAGHVERVPASTIRALISRGAFVHCFGSEGGYGGRLSARIIQRRAELELAQVARASSGLEPVTAAAVSICLDGKEHGQLSRSR